MRLAIIGGVALSVLILGVCGVLYYTGVTEAQKNPALQKCETLNGAWKKGRCYLPDGTVAEGLGIMNSNTGNGEGQ